MKNGIEYFPLDVCLDDKFELLEAEFGLTGFGVVVKILQKIYGGQGYYFEWTNEVALLFAKKIGLGGNVVSEIVSASIKRGIFDAKLFAEYGILTSSGIQKRYFEAVSRRKNVSVKNEYLLGRYAQKFKNVDILGENAYIFNENVDISKQSRVEESRVEYTSSARAREDDDVTLEDVKSFCEKNGIKGIAEDFYRHYSALGWKDGSGKKIQSWKAFLLKYAADKKKTAYRTDAEGTATAGSSFNGTDFVKAAIDRIYGNTRKEGRQ